METAQFPAADRKICQAILTPQNDTELSSLYTMIPSMVRSRIPVLTSFRRSVKSSTTRRPPPRITPIPDNERIQELGRSNSTRSSTASSRSESPEPLEVWTLARGGLNIQDTKSGVDWDTAAAGVRLWMDAKAQAGQNANANPKLLRRMHIEAIRYMQMALPSDLSPAEVDSLRESLPRELQMLPEPVLAFQHQPQQPNVLRQSVSRVVTLLVTLLVLLVPVLTAVLNRLLRYEREHRIGERLLNNGIGVADALGERGLDVRDALTRFSQGRVGTAIFASFFWVVDGLVGGFNDGIIHSTKVWQGH